MVGASVLVGISIVVFLSLHLAPGDPVMAFLPPDMSTQPSQEQLDELRAKLGLDRPLHVQYLEFAGRILRFDFGTSVRTGRLVVTDVLYRFPATIELATVGLIISVIIGLGVGIISAVKRNSLLDNLARPLSFMGVSIPGFWLGIIGIMLFSLRLGWLPSSGRGGPIWTVAGMRHMVLPALTVGLPGSAMLVRMVRTSVLNVLNEDYIRTARAKGLSERVVIYRHALKNALIPVITLLGLRIGAMLGGNVIIESVFAWPGMGQYMINAIRYRDYPIVQSTVLLMATSFVVVNTLIDVVYGIVDPRIRLS
jgi:peptide/nickel transport system permease protein